jgi:antagonist of KipI
MSIEVIKAGLLSTIVASERRGFRYLGIGTSGAMDHFAMAVSNYLVGNDEDSATLEINFPAPEFLFQKDHLVAVAGKGFRILLNDKTFSSWKPLWVKKETIMKFEKIERGGRAYLAIHEGFKVQKWLGSFTTHLGVRAGGHLGRALQKGDILMASDFFQPGMETKNLPWGILKNELDKIYLPYNEIRIVESVETDLLSPESKEKLLTTEFKIANQSNRMGYRLEGEKLTLTKQFELVSSAVDFGTIQLLPDGNLIILTADHQTTGGYPRIGSVIKSDLPKLAQLNPNDKISFKLITLNAAENKLQERTKLLTELKQACFNQHKNYFKT